MKYMNEIIRNFREDNDLKQEDVANFLRIPRSTYARYEIAGTNVDLDIIKKLCLFYETTPNEMLGFTAKSHLSNAKISKLCRTIRKKHININALIQMLENIDQLFQ